MCSIFGLGFQKGHKVKDVKAVKDIMAGLLIAGQSRGSDAAGVAVTSAKKIIVLKDPITGTQLSKSDGFERLFSNDVKMDTPNASSPSPSTLSILGHCRAQTQGTYMNNDNNHPIVADKVVGVHNGMISNDYNLFQIFPEMNRKAEVDSEVIFRLMSLCIDKGKSIQEAVQIAAKQLTGWFACAAVSKTNPYTMWLFRDRTPIVVHHYKQVGLIAFATAKNMIDDAFKHQSFGQPTTIVIPQESGMGIDLWSGDFTKFEFGGDLTMAKGKIH